MQKIVNIIAIASGVVSLTVVGSGIYLYTQKDAIIESVTEKALGSGGALSGGGLPGLPEKTAPEADLPDFAPSGPPVQF